MTDDYTPSLNEVRADYVAIHTRNFDSYATGRSLTSEQEVYASRFDRWLASHDADVAERIAQEIEADLVWDDLGRLNSFGLGQEYAVRLIRQIAARIAHSHATPPFTATGGDDSEPVAGSEDGASDAKASVIHTMISRRDTLTLKSRYGANAVYIVNMMFKRVQPPRLGYGRKDLLLDFIILSELFAKMQTSSTPCIRTPKLVHAIEVALGDFSGLSDWQQYELYICLARLNSADLVIITSKKGKQTRYELSPYWNDLARTFWARQK